MAQLKSFKEVIVNAHDRQSLYEVLDTIIECSDKESIVAFYNRKTSRNSIFDNQLELELQLEANKKRNNENTEPNPMGGRAQG